MYKSIKVKNLRAITEIEIDNLEQVNLFVGRNNCGKTTLLEAIFFLIGGTNPSLPQNANTFRGLNVVSNVWWPTFFHNMDISANIEISAKVSDTNEDQKLLIRPKIKGSDSAEVSESDFVTFDVESGDSKPPVSTHGLELKYTDKSGTSISTIALKGHELVTEGIKKRPTQGIFVCPLIQLSWKDRFASVQRNKKVTDLISALKEIEPHITDIRLNDIGFLEADIGLPILMPVNLMGGGIIKFLSVALAMLDARDGIVLIDEIENGLNESAQQKLWKAVFNWSSKLNVQVFATTHSWECIGAFNKSAVPDLFEINSKLFRIEREKDQFRSIEYTKDILAESLESKWEIR